MKRDKMSLSNIIKNMHKKKEDEVSLIPAIEKHLMSKARSKDEDVWLDKMTRFHPSKVTYSGVCSRAYNLFMQRDRLGFKFTMPSPHETSLLRIFEHGHSIHSLYQDKILGPSGVLYGKWEKDGTQVKGFMPGEDWKYVEPRIIWKEFNMSGYCDGIVCTDGTWAVVEIKSANSNSFKYMKATNTPRASHVKQAQLYLFAPNDLELEHELTGAVILYINKDTGEELEFFVKKDYSIIKPILDEIRQSIIDLDKWVIAPTLYECKTPKSKRAKDCIACTFCFMREDYV